MGNAQAKRPHDDMIASGDGHTGQIAVGSPTLHDSSFVFPGHELLPPDEVIQEQNFNAKHVPAMVRWKGGGSEVYISGSYDNWQNKLRLNRSHDNFVAIIELPEGEHEYKFLVDGEWKVDPNEPTKKTDYGTVNNVLEVKPSDFKVFEALAFDSAVTKRDVIKEKYNFPQSDVYTQDVPCGLLEDSSLHPPVLPPHLLNKVLLNQDIEMSYEPSLLPEPQHIMLNHMYALSIRDGVMALSATHRCKKKFVTTLLYKPI